jgi:hypothetical protein
VTGIGMYGAGEMCTNTSVREPVRMLGLGRFVGDGKGVGAGARSGPGVVGFRSGILM